MNMRIFLWYWVPVLFYAGLIVTLSSMSTPQTHFPSWFDGISDKIWHAMEYAVLAILCYRAFLYGAGSRVAAYAVPLAMVAAILFGATDEIHQYFVPLRDGGWLGSSGRCHRSNPRGKNLAGDCASTSSRSGVIMNVELDSPCHG